MERRPGIAAFALVLLASAPAAAEQERPPTTAERLGRIEQLLEELSASVSTTLAPEVGTASEAARRAEGRIAELEERIADLADELRDLQGGSSALEERAEADRRRVEELEAQAEALVEREEARAAAPQLSWSRADGLAFRPEPGTLSLVLRGFVLGLYEGSFRREPGGWSYGSEFSVPETRLRLVTSMVDGLLRVAIEPSFSEGSARVQDAYLELAPHEVIRLRVGQMRVPFDREWELDREAQPLTDRGELARTFGHGRDLGAMALGDLSGGQLSYGIGIWNGAGAGNPNDNYDLLVALRLRYTVLGLHSGTWSDLGRSTSPNLSLGLGFSYDLAETEADDGSGRHYNRAVYQLTADGLLQWWGAHLAAAVHYQASDHGAAGDVVHAYGYLVQAGYLAWPGRLEVLARYTALDPDVLGLDDHGRQVDAGLNLFLAGYHARLALLYSYAFRLPGREPDELRRDGHAVRVLAEGWF